MSEGYKTTDLALASYLKLKGFKPEITLRGKQGIFIFVGEVREEVKHFYDGDGDFFIYQAHSRGLKSQVENLMEGGTHSA